MLKLASAWRHEIHKLINNDFLFDNSIPRGDFRRKGIFNLKLLFKNGISFDSFIVMVVTKSFYDSRRNATDVMPSNLNLGTKFQTMFLRIVVTLTSMILPNEVPPIYLIPPVKFPPLSDTPREVPPIYLILPVKFPPSI